MKILWLSDAGCTTGFGRVTHAIGERLVEDYGHEVHVLAVNYRGDAWPCERPGHDHTTPLRLYRPNALEGSDNIGYSRILEMLAKVEPDVVIILNDPQILLRMLFGNTRFDPKNVLLQYRPILYYVPVDGTNVPPLWTEPIPKVTTTLTMSKHGATFFDSEETVWHGADTELFWPIWEKPKTTTTGLTITTKEEAKAAFGYSADSFLIGRVDSNSERKDYASMIKALWPLMEKHEEVIAHLHCQNEGGTGIRFDPLLSRNPNVDPDRFFFPGLHNSFEGWAIQDLNVLYSAFDLFVSTSRGEGFGLTLLEAASCGIPIVAQDVSAIPEVCGPGATLIEPLYTYTVKGGHDNWLPDVDAFSKAIEELYDDPDRRAELGKAGAAHAKTFSWDYAARKFDEYVTKLANAEPAVTTEASEDPNASA